MGSLEEEKDCIIRNNVADIVPVHTVTRNSGKQPRESPIMKIKNGECSQPSDENLNFSNWLWGGPLGDRRSLLIFRSCALAPEIPNNSTSEDSISDITKKYDVFNVSGGSEIFDNDDPDFQPFGSPVNDWNYVTEPKKNATLKKQNSQESPSKWKTNFKNVLCDINKMTTKNKHLSKTSSNFILKGVSKITEPIGRASSKDKRNASDSTMSNKLTSKSSSLPSAMNHLAYDPDSYSLDSAFSSYSLISSSFDNVAIPAKNKMPAAILNITFKTAMTETKLLNKMLKAHGMNDADPQSNDFNILWSGLHPKPDILRSLASHQRVNHFPRSYELTRKDKLFKNIEKMQYVHGLKNFDFIPLSFLMPLEYRELCTTHYRIKGPWIVKPAASSRGRGIYIVNSPDQIPKGESVVVAKYIDRPLLVDGHKCDLRIYVCITSFDPLLIYIYEEGLARFATVKYDKNNKSLWNPCMHLCNYSINKYHSDYISCEDPSAENVGHKWTLSAFLRHLRKEGHDTSALMTSIEDLVIKSIFSCTQSIASASRMFVPYFNNCFELYGFDILIDENLKPWLLEINLSPSLGCDTPLDVRLKAALLADTLNLVGIPAIDPTAKIELNRSRKSSNSKTRTRVCRRVHSADNMLSKRRGFNTDSASDYSALTSEEIRLIKYTKAQYQRRGGYVRIFPSQDSWRKYAQYLDPIAGVPISNSTSKNIPLNSLNVRNSNLLLHKYILPNFDATVITQTISSNPPERLKRYERILPACNRVVLENRDKIASARSKSSASGSKISRLDIRNQILDGPDVSICESRRAFGMFLTCVLRRISKSTTEQSVQHAELILRFLKKISHTLKMPYNIKVPSHKMTDKDKTAVIAKQLNDFLLIYYKEIDLNDDKSKLSGANSDFIKFISNADEEDLEDVLLMILKKEGSVVPFLGDKQSPICVDIPPNTLNQLYNKNVPFRHQLIRYLAYITPVHSRRFKPPTFEHTSGLPNVIKK